MKKLKIGIIGFGNFGRVMAKAFQRDKSNHQVQVYSRRAEPDGKLFFELEEVCKSDWLFPCMPISAFADLLKSIAPLLSPDTVVIDVCSVKVFPVKWMRENLKDDQPMIASHPMFGPNSTKQGTEFNGLKMMVHNLSAQEKTFQDFVDFWRKLGIDVVEMTPDEHDELAANSHLYAQMINRLTQKMKLRETPIDTPGFQKILQASHAVPHDTDELYADMNNFNPYSEAMRKKFFEHLNSLERIIENGQKPD